MLTTQTMELLNIAVFKEKAEAVIARLLQMGLFHLIDIRSVEEELSNLSITQMEQEYLEWSGLELKARDLLKKLNVSVTIPPAAPSIPLERVKTALDEVGLKTDPLYAEQEDLRQNIKTREAILKQVRESFPIQLRSGAFYSFIEVAFGRISIRNMPQLEKGLEKIPHVIYPFGREEHHVQTLVIVLRRDRSVLEAVLRELAWEKIEQGDSSPQISAEIQNKLSREIEEYRKKVIEVQRQSRIVAESVRPEIAQYLFNIRLKKALLEARRYTPATETTVLLSGWIPRDQRQRVIDEIKKITAVSYIEGKKPEEVNVPKEEIPVLLRHGALVKPFELLIETYGTPRYGTVDPTVFVAISFLLMFGIMFGDIGDGAVLVLLSFLLLKKQKEKVKQVGALTLYCGISAMLFGVFYGSFMGWEFRSLWLRPIDHIFEMFKDSIMLGVIIVSFGILINVINALRDRDYLKMFFDKAGLVAGVVYWATIGLVVKVMVGKEHFSPWYGFVIAAGLLVLFLGPVVWQIMKKRGAHLGDAFIESIVTLLEVVMGYLTNTVSFIRIAAFSLAHAGLFIAIFKLSEISHKAGGTFLSFLVVFFGNVFVILLEGLVVTIQALRLNYYEFFSKFYLTGRKVYKPLIVETK